MADLDARFSGWRVSDRGAAKDDAGSIGEGRGGNQGAKGVLQTGGDLLTVTPSGNSIVSGGHAPTRRCARPRQARPEVSGSTRLPCAKSGSQSWHLNQGAYKEGLRASNIGL